jgi:hypothetical protein
MSRQHKAFSVNHRNLTILRVGNLMEIDNLGLTCSKTMHSSPPE